MLRTVVELGKDCDPIWDVQAIVGSNDKGDLSRELLNKALQAELNATGESHADWPFKVGDKIVNRKNGWFKAIEADPEERNERGEAIVPMASLPKLWSWRQVFRLRISGLIAYCESQRWALFELGYALTAHCQGAEWPKVVVGSIVSWHRRRSRPLLVYRYQPREGSLPYRGRQITS